MSLLNLDKKTKIQKDKRTKGKKTKREKASLILWCDVRAVSHSCNVFVISLYPIGLLKENQKMYPVNSTLLHSCKLKRAQNFLNLKAKNCSTCPLQYSQDIQGTSVEPQVWSPESRWRKQIENVNIHIHILSIIKYGPEFVWHWGNDGDQVNLIGEGLPEGQGKGDEDEADIEESGVDLTTSTDEPSVSVHNVKEPDQGTWYMFKDKQPLT